MEKKIPTAIGPYRICVAFEQLLFVSGQIGVDPSQGELVGNDVDSQMRQALENLKSILEEQGSSLERVLKTTIFLTNINDFSAVNQIYANYFVKDFPARSTVCVKSLPKNALVEIEAIARR